MRRTAMEELERIEASDGATSDFQKRFNVNQKRAANIIGKNLTLFVCMLLPLLLIGLIWVDLGEILFDTKIIGDGAITVCLFITGELLMTRLGTDGGKLDADYTTTKSEYDRILQKVQQTGTMLLGVFCDWQIDVELQQAIHYRLRLLRMAPKQYEEIKDLNKKQLQKKYGKEKGRKLFAIINLAPIELNEAILLYNGEHTARGGVPESGEAFLNRKSHIISTVIGSVFAGLLTVSIAMTLTSDITIARVIYTVFKLTMLLFRMASGYSRGAKAYNTVEVRQLKAKTNYLYQYQKFMDDKMYMGLGDKYGDISCYIDNEMWNLLPLEEE